MSVWKVPIRNKKEKIEITFNQTWYTVWISLFCQNPSVIVAYFSVWFIVILSISVFSNHVFAICLQEKEEQWMTKLVPGVNDIAVLQPLQWNTRYNVEITARNLKGLSEPTFFQFLMPQKPDITGTRMSSVTNLRFIGVCCVFHSSDRWFSKQRYRHAGQVKPISTNSESRAFPSLHTCTYYLNEDVTRALFY